MLTIASALILTVTASASGTFTDRDGGQHPWEITSDHVLIWDGEPYVPFGGMFGGHSFWQDSDAALDRDRRVLTTIREHEIEDLYINPVRRVPPARLQHVIDIIEELGFRYGLQICTPPQSTIEGYAVPSGEETTARWITDADMEDTQGYLRQLSFGPGLRFLIDPIGNEYNPPRAFVPADPEWRGEFAELLRARYRSVGDLAASWALGESPASYEQAARLVPQPDASALDHESGRSFAVDLALSRMHDDICEARELSIQRRLNDLCDGLKEVVDVPVIAKRHHEATRVWSNQDDSGGLDGLGMESYAGGDRLGTFNGAATYAEVVQAKRPMWCLVTEYNGVTWTDRHITYQTREEMCSDLNLLLGMGARGVFMFGLSLAGSDGDKNWTIFELINDPRQLEWLATFGRAARADLNWLTRQPDVAFAYPPQNSDARAFAQTEDYGLSGSWAGERSILKLGPGRWLAPVYTPDVPGPILHSPLIDGEPRFARERAAVRGKRHYATDLADPLSLPGGLAKRFAQTPRPSVDIGISTPVPGVEAVEWRDAKGTPHITLRAIGEAASITISANRANARATALGLPHTIALAAAQLAPRQFIIANPSFIKEPATFECPVGDSPAPFELAGIALADILITVD